MKNQTVLALGFSVFLLSSCKKEKNGPDQAATHNVYVGGTVVVSPETGKRTAAFWKNGTLIEQGQSSFNTTAKAIFVEGTNVYTTGYENTSNGWQCRVWKNGALEYTLGDGLCDGRSIAVLGTDIYVAGHTYEQTLNGTYHYAALWKNQEVTILTDGLQQAEAVALAVAGENVYVAGYYGQEARCWKNGQIQPLTGATGYLASGITVRGNDVYMVGYSYSLPLKTRVWKNGIPTDISSGTGDAWGKSIAVSENGDVYVAGYEFLNNVKKARLWKNGIPETLNTDEPYADANAVVVIEDSIYVAGTIQLTSSVQEQAVLWKNGTQIILGQPGSSANSLFVK